MDDIPEAIRETEPSKSSSQLPLIAIVGGVVTIGAIALLSAIFFSRPNPTIKENTTSELENPEQIAKAQALSDPLSNSENNNNTQAQNIVTSEDLLGHLPYEEVSDSELTSISSDGRLKLRSSAAQKFKQMQAAAIADGILLTPISAFRSVSEQDYLFFRVKEQRVQGAAKRAEVSAPPGYSEHHTGYALDLGDGKVPSANLEVEFEKTAAFRWLEANAAKYSFELSFPRDNPQGISYEPWHWRYVGDRHSLETFYKARNLK